MSVGASLTQRLPLVELKGPVFESGTIWQPNRSLQEPSGSAANAVQHSNDRGHRIQQKEPIRTRDLRQQQVQQQPTSFAAATNSTPRLHYHHSHNQLHREASQITMATVAMERQRRKRDKKLLDNKASASIELDGRHLSAVGQRRQRETPSLPATAATGETAAATSSQPSPPPSLPTLYTTAANASKPDSTQSGSLPFMQKHLRRHRTLLELTMGRDRLVVDAFAESPSPSDRLAARMRAYAGEPTPGQASILQRQQAASSRQQQAASSKQQQQQQEQQQQQQQKPNRRRLSRREKTAQTISRAILTYERSL